MYKKMTLSLLLLAVPALTLAETPKSNNGKQTKSLNASTNVKDELVLRYDKPAISWQREALPLGNGSLGAMVFSGPHREQIQFNEETLWSGDEQDVGSYQSFGDIFIYLSNQAYYSCESGHDSQDTKDPQNITFASDGNLDTQWGIYRLGHTKTEDIIYQAFYPGKQTVRSYSLSATKNQPPKNWILQASKDSLEWVELDKQTDQNDWEGKVTTKSFKISNKRAFRYYRLVFQKTRNIEVAEITFNTDKPLPKGALSVLGG